MSAPFWINQPTILLNKKYIFDVFPSEGMTLEEKFNSITKIIIILTFIGLIFSQNIQILIIGVLTIAIITFIYYRKKKQYIDEHSKTAEGFKNSNANNNNTQPTNELSLNELMKEQYYNSNKKNPLGNVLLTEISSTPDRLSAPPAFNPEVNDKINSDVKRQTQMLNPTIDGTNKQIYGDLYENYNLDQSMSRFYATANTRVENDQGAFAQWLYGNMPSAKEDNVEGNIQRLKDNYRYILM